MFFDHEDHRQVRNPWWCGGEILLSTSRENEFWTYKWLNHFFSTIAGLVGIFLPRQDEEESLVSENYEMMHVDTYPLNKEPVWRAVSRRSKIMDVRRKNDEGCYKLVRKRS